MAASPTIVNIVPNSPPLPTRGPLVIALVYDGLCTFEYGVTVEVFGLSRPELGPDWYRFASCAIEPGPLRAVGGLRVDAEARLELLDEADLIIVPGWKGVDVEPAAELIRALRRAHTRGARLMSICSGVFVLAATGLLDGLRVTTHWRYAAALKAKHPTLQFDNDVLYVDQGQILTSAGSAAGLDLSLHVVRRDFGPDAANQVARRLVLPAHRNGGQRQYVERPVPEREDARLSDLLATVRANPGQPISVAEMARIAAMSKRTLHRRFLQTVGEPPANWLIGIRVDHARELLETRDVPMEELARLCGFGSAAALRHHFRRRIKVSPSQYRTQYGREAQVAVKRRQRSGSSTPK
ncbi:MAG: transcriptional regulator FtrA [Steroidobacteraceae bacterium]